MGSILGWLDSIFNIVTGPFADIWHWIVNAFKSVWSFIYGMYAILAKGITEVSHALSVFTKAIEKFIVTGVDNLYHLALKWVTDLRNWAIGEFDRIIKFANSVLKWTVQQIDHIRSLITSVFDAITHWVITEIYDPLKNAVDGAIGWIEKEGAYVYDLVTHPEKLVTLLEAYLAATWLVWLNRLTLPLARLYLQTYRHLAVELISVLEDVISKVL